MSFPVNRGKRQGEWCVSYYGLVKEPRNGLHGIYQVIGVYDEEDEALADAKRFRLKHDNIGGHFLVHKTGLAEPILDDTAPARQRVKTSDDIDSFYHEQQQQERKRRDREREEVLRRQRLTEQEELAYDDPATLESYSKLKMRETAVRSALAHHRQEVTYYEGRLAFLEKELADRDTQYPSYSGQWEEFVKKEREKGPVAAVLAGAELVGARTEHGGTSGLAPPLETLPE